MECGEDFHEYCIFLVPKKEIVYLNINSSMRQALEKMEYHRYTAIPLIDAEGKYVGTLTEGDLLWKMKAMSGLPFSATQNVKVKQIPLRVINQSVRINSEIEDLLSLAIVQNFIPVVDDHDSFIGIIRRREIIEYFANQQYNSSQQRIS